MGTCYFYTEYTNKYTYMQKKEGEMAFCTWTPMGNMRSGYRIEEFDKSNYESCKESVCCDYDAETTSGWNERIYFPYKHI